MAFRVFTTQYVYLSHIEYDSIRDIIDRYLDEEGDVMEDEDPSFADVMGWIEDWEPENKNLMLGFMSSHGIKHSCTIKWMV